MFLLHRTDELNHTLCSHAQKDCKDNVVCCMPNPLSDKFACCVHGFNVIIIETLVCTSWCSLGGCTTPFNPAWSLCYSTLNKNLFVQCRKANFHRKLVDDYITLSHLLPFEKSFESDQAPWNSDLPSHRDESTWGVSTGGEGQMEAKIETKGA